MKIATRAALYSGLVLPGLGQIYTGKRKKGYAIAGAVISLIAWLGVRIFRLVYHVLITDEGFENLIFYLDEKTLATIHRMAYRQNLWLVILIVGLWLYSTLDAHRTGKRWDHWYALSLEESPGNHGASSGGRSG